MNTEVGTTTSKYLLDEINRSPDYCEWHRVWFNLRELSGRGLVICLMSGKQRDQRDKERPFIRCRPSGCWISGAPIAEDCSRDSQGGAFKEYAVSG